MYYEENYIRPIRVVLSCNQEWVNEQTVKITNCEENIMGEDVLTFVCPRCGKTHQSRRLG